MNDRELAEDEEVTLGEGVSSELEEDKAEDGDLSRDDFFSILSNSRRCAILRYMDLREDQAPFSTGELAEVVAAYENDTVPKLLTSDQRKTVYVGIYQVHLPNLDKNGVVDYDDDLGWVYFLDDEERHVFDGLVALLEDEVYPEDRVADEEFFEEYLANYGETEEDDETYLSRFRQKLPF